MNDYGPILSGDDSSTKNQTINVIVPQMSKNKRAILALEDGTVFHGIAIGDEVYIGDDSITNLPAEFSVILILLHCLFVDIYTAISYPG